MGPFSGSPSALLLFPCLTNGLVVGTTVSATPNPGCLLGGWDGAGTAPPLLPDND